MKKLLFLLLFSGLLFSQTWVEFPGSYSNLYRFKLIKIDSSITFTQWNSQYLYTHNPENNTVVSKYLPGMQAAYSGIYHFSEMYFSQYRKIRYGANYDYVKIGNDTLSVYTAHGYIRFDVSMSSYYNKTSVGSQNGIISYTYTNEPFFVDDTKVLLGRNKGIYELTYPDSFREILIKDDRDFYIREIIKVGNSFYAFGRQYNSDTTSTDEIFVYQSIGGYEDFNLVKTFDAGMVYSFNYNQDSSKCWFIIESQDTTKQDRGVWVVKSSGDFSKYISSFPDEYMTALSVTGNEFLIAFTNNSDTTKDILRQYYLRRLRKTYSLGGSVTQLIRNGNFVYTHYHRTTDLFPINTMEMTNPKYTEDIPFLTDTRFLPFRRKK